MRDQPEPPEEEGPGPEREGALRPLSPVVLGAWGGVGFVVGWAVHSLADRFGVVPPTVAWSQPLGLVLLVVLLGSLAWTTRRTVHVERHRLESDQAVNRLLLARASALVTALVGAAYLGYGVSWIGDPAALADQRMWRSFFATAACVAGLAAALLLERACRVPRDDSGE